MCDVDDKVKLSVERAGSKSGGQGAASHSLGSRQAVKLVPTALAVILVRAAHKAGALLHPHIDVEPLA